MANPHWLFTLNVGAHLVASMSGLVSFIFSLWEHARKQKIEAWAFFAIGCLCLIVAFDQAWQDEHRNAQLVIAEKASAVKEREFWKTQSYDKDSALRERDTLFGKTASTLSETQSSLATLANKVLDINKPERQEFTVRRDDTDPAQFSKWKNRTEFFVLTNVPAEAHFRLSCDGDIPAVEAYILEGGPRFPGSVVQIDQKTWAIRIPSPQISRDHPLIINLGSDEKVEKCSLAK